VRTLLSVLLLIFSAATPSMVSDDAAVMARVRR
jgi:hypothetical protein